MAKDGLKYVLNTEQYTKFKKQARTKMIEKRLQVTVAQDQSSSSVSSDEFDEQDMKAFELKTINTEPQRRDRQLETLECL